MKPLAALLILLLAACATPPPPPTGSVAMAPGVTFALPSPAALGRTIEALQLVTARRGNDVFSFEAHLSVSPTSLLLVGTDGMGQRIMTLHWDGKTLDVEKASWIPEQLRPENVLADVMLIYWPDAEITGASKEFSSQSRRLLKDGQEVVRIAYDGEPWTGIARLTNLVWGYEIEVRSTLVGP